MKKEGEDNDISVKKKTPISLAKPKVVAIGLMVPYAISTGTRKAGFPF